MKPFLTAALIVITAIIFYGCTNKESAKHNAQAYLDTHYSSLHLKVVCFLSAWNEGNMNLNNFAFLAVDQQGNEITGSWDNSKKQISNIQPLYNEVLKRKKQAAQLMQYLGDTIKSDVYFEKKEAGQTLNHTATTAISMFCFTEINTQNQSVLLSTIRERISRFARETQLGPYKAVIIFVYQNRPKKTKPYKDRSFSDLYAPPWQSYDGYLEAGASMPEQKYYSAPVHITGSGFFVKELREKAWTQISKKFPPEKNAQAAIYIRNQPRFFLVNRHNLDEIFFMFEQRDRKGIKAPVLLTGYYNVTTSLITAVKSTPVDATKARLNKDLEEFVPENCRVDLVDSFTEKK
ncbi:hypothetical protein [Flavobacterium sp. FlaQc-48]|uniref:hypothetical protein n=1 Tax=Flavobacterium sp. FlaQc-48 TaxID=3374181 RepID=UPI003757327E